METPSLSHFSSKDYNNFYEPAEDSFLLLDALEQELEIIKILKPSVCVEIGSGSGIVITALAKAVGKSCSYTAVDVNLAACEATQSTSESNGVNVEVVSMDLLSAFCWKNKVDILIFNPPYVVTPSEEVYEKGMFGELSKAWSGGKRGREVMDRIFPEISDILTEDGIFYMIAISDNCPEDIEHIMNNLGFVMEIVQERSIRGEHLLVLKFTRK
ncbi:hypothetical protein L9F63_019155 [Diploptera punctata]|uniref:Methyltransferase HEMK2 n=1 Tax=Diploptera punctata TaxID=6984 RepID=A0AAD7ZV82_DIPPU|nr:hypothetical protein L9F63_019155 [Diploptera punctata]